jgi:peptidoglycan/LPS O-acetylase OafA/YrhL
VQFLRSNPLGIQQLRVSDDLDLVRGLAAFAVLIYHVRYRFFYDYADVHAPNVLGKLFYSATSFGHDAVIIFFVLSGYFISASVLRDAVKQRWSWGRYAVSRLTRLYLVLIPGLLLTLFWDRLGLWLFPEHPIYSGQATWINDYFPVAQRISPRIFAANLGFLQTVVAPPLGSNEALWSLSNEFWYYVLFPLAWFALVWPTRWLKSIVGLLIFAAILWYVGISHNRGIADYFPIWLLGTAVCVLPPIKRWQRNYGGWFTAAALGLFCVVLATTHVGAVKQLLRESQLAIDYFTGVSFALTLYVLLHNQLPVANGQSSATSGAYAKLARGLAGCSYTLYLTHLPILVFIRGAGTAEPWLPDGYHMVLAFLLTVLCLGFAFGIAKVTEARTAAVRDYFLRRLSSGMTRQTAKS